MNDDTIRMALYHSNKQEYTMKIWFVYYQSPRGLGGMVTVNASTKEQAEAVFLAACPGHHIEKITDR
jgi:hypothetical protein